MLVYGTSKSPEEEVDFSLNTYKPHLYETRAMQMEIDFLREQVKLHKELELSLLDEIEYLKQQKKELSNLIERFSEQIISGGSA